jgi:hypothetical protein
MTSPSTSFADGRYNVADTRSMDMIRPPCAEAPGAVGPVLGVSVIRLDATTQSGA